LNQEIFQEKAKKRRRRERGRAAPSYGGRKEDRHG